MIANALLFTIVILLAYGFWLLDQLKFMARYKAILYHAYGTPILLFLVVLCGARSREDNLRPFANRDESGRLRGGKNGRTHPCCGGEGHLEERADQGVPAREAT
jgi:hypothetical protein